MRLSKTAYIEVTTVSDVVMLVPPSKHSRQDNDLFEPSLGATDNTLVHGTVTVSLRKGRTIKEILVELVSPPNLALRIKRQSVDQAADLQCETPLETQIARQSVIVDGFRHTYGIRGAFVSIPIASGFLHAGIYK